MRIHISEEIVEIRLSRVEKVLGLMRDIRVPRAAVYDVGVVADGVGEAMAAGLKVGLRVPWLRFVARTIRLDQAFIVRRGVPALAFSVTGQEPLERVLVSTPEAAVLAARLSSG
jgi:hypothetical protein